MLVLFIWGCSEQNISEKKPTLQKPENLLSYEILKEAYPNDKSKNLMLDVLVSPDSKKEKIIELSRYFRKYYIDKHWLMINIWSSKESFENRMNDKYPESKYWKHYLVQIIHSRNKDDILWVKDGKIESVPIE